MKRILCVLITLCLVSLAAFTQSGVRKQRVAFSRGTSSKVIKGTITGDDTIDYVVKAAEGQTMKVTLQTSNAANYFNVTPPGSEAAIFVGSTSGNKYDATLPTSGDYAVRVYLMRSAARRRETAHYTLSITITGRPDALVKGTPYHATGTVPCSVGTDPKGSAQCSFGVIRSGQDHAEVYLAEPGLDVTLHKDKLRILQFAGNTVTSSDPKEKVTVTKDSDNWLINIDDFCFYTIPDAVINGG